MLRSTMLRSTMLHCLTVTLAWMPTTFAATPDTALGHKVISASRFVDNIRTLSSDDFEGRGPGTPGEDKTIAFLQQQFSALGLKPGNPNGSFLQAVPVVGITSTPQLSYQIGAKKVALNFPDDYVAYSSRPLPKVQIANSELVFVGYGIVAPEYDWDDYKGVDVRGKTIVMLINDPPIPDPRDGSKLDASMFKGEAMTYYGRWTYKYEMAAKMGAAAALIVHETKPAAYPYDVVRKGGTSEHFDLKSEGPNPAFPPVPGWIHLDRAREMMAAAGLDFDQLKKQALSKNFRPVSLGGSVNIAIDSKTRELASHNVVAMVEGSDPQLKNELIVYSAHWDHFGIDPSLPGPKSKQVFHGALDNASGTSALLELARAYKALPVAPKRSILFLATTLEERGLLGALYYARHPLYRLSHTLANINFDNMNAWGRTAVIENVTSGHSSLDATLARHAAAQGRLAESDSRPELGSFYRADHVEFAKEGVPALYTKSRSKYLNQPPSYARERVDAYVAHDYHQVGDTLNDSMDFSGAIEDIRLMFDIGFDIAQGSTWPQWNPGSEFKAKRDATMKDCCR